MDIDSFAQPTLMYELLYCLFAWLRVSSGEGGQLWELGHEWKGSTNEAALQSEASS